VVVYVEIKCGCDENKRVCADTSFTCMINCAGGLQVFQNNFSGNLASAASGERVLA